VAYFPNGSSFDGAMCERCVHNGDGETSKPCAVLGLHLLWNYDQCSDKVKEEALNNLWPRKKGECFNGDCLMFIAGTPADAETKMQRDRDQARLAEHERLYGKRA
jgi:hypothetical protein